MDKSVDTHSGGHKTIGWFLCWAVVFADIGTSIYYVPGILNGQVHNLAGLFVIMSSLVFVLLVLKYIEITARYPEGGGVVTVATHAFGQWFGALGGMFITVDYFLTAAISSVSGFAYLNSILNIGSAIVILAIIALVLLGILNVIGIQESAKITAVVAVAAFIVDIILVIIVSTQIGAVGWGKVFSSLTGVSQQGVWTILTGFAGSFLAFSGLESISQLSPVMANPRRKIATIAMGLVVVSILFTSPLLTLFSTNVLDAKVPDGSELIIDRINNVDARIKELSTTTSVEQQNILQAKIDDGKAYSDRFISELGARYGGTAIKLAIVLTASILLIFASNTAIIGAYHVFIALSKQNFLPQFLQTRNKKFDTYHWAVLLAVSAPIVIVIVTRGDVNLLGELYAFGLLGAFGLSSLGLDVIRWKESKKITPGFLLGVITTFFVCLAWIVNLYNKQLATVFGGGITLIGMIIAYLVHRHAKSVKNRSTEEVIAEAEVETAKTLAIS